MFQQMDESLNYYSKNSKAREKRNITSLYSLIEDGEAVSFKVTLPRDNVLGRRNESMKEMNGGESALKYFQLQGMHEYERFEILKYASRDTLSRNQSAKSVLSRGSLTNAEKWKRRALLTSSQIVGEEIYPQATQQNKHQGLQLAQSVFQDEQEENREQMPESLVIDKIVIDSAEKISDPEFFRKQSMPCLSMEVVELPQILQNNLAVTPQPLQPQIQQSKVTNLLNSEVAMSNDIEIPDKISDIEADVGYDQKDFFDLADSPIELIKQDTNRHLSSHFISQNRINELKEILIDINADKPLPAQPVDQTPQPPTPIQPPLEIPAKPKKLNFKAMMAKSKPSEPEHQKQQYKKRLLLNFFDEN